MPHECTECGRGFADGSTEMLSGCPSCGGTTFQFKPPDGSPDDGENAPDPPSPPVESNVARTVGSAASAVRGLVDRGGNAEEPRGGAVSEDAAQATARTEVVSPDHLPPSPDRPVTTEEGVAQQRDVETEERSSEASTRPELADLRAELNEQFESIKVVEPGQYELNLMELYDREEYIVALQEDGKYTIQVPERWQE